MLRFAVLFCLLVSNAFGATVILEKRATSGYVMPEYSFTKECKVYREGYMESITKKGDGTITGFSKPVSHYQINKIRGLLLIARYGKIKETPMPCDIGSTILKGYVYGTTVELDVALDCGTHRRNTSSVTPILKDIAKDLCAF